MLSAARLRHHEPYEDLVPAQIRQGLMAAGPADSIMFPRLILLLLALLLATGAHAQSSTNRPVLENSAVRLAYDLTAGTFDIIDLVNGRVCLQGAHTEVESWSSLQTNCSREASLAPVTDSLGSGHRLTVRCVPPMGPVLISEFTLHGSTDPALILRSGLQNNTRAELRVKEFHPLAGGIVFPGGGLRSDVRTLNGDSACNQAHVLRQPYLSSGNNLLLTFKEGTRHRTLVLGGLQTAEFTKWAHTFAGDGLDLRGVALAQAMPSATLAAYLDAGTRDRSRLLRGPILSVQAGQPYTFPSGSGYERFGTVMHDGKEIVIQAQGLDPSKRYAVGLSWWDYDANGRVQSVKVGMTGQKPVTLFSRLALPKFISGGQQATEMAALIPAEAYAEGKTRIGISNDSSAPNAVISEIWLWELAPDATLPATWRNGQPVTPDTSSMTNAVVVADLEGSDPVGKVIDAGTTYLPEDSFYVNAGLSDPFEALEYYGKHLRAATGAQPSFYDFPTVCAWYAGVWKTPGAQNHPEKSKYQINTSAGLVKELQAAREAGMFRYSRVAGRLVPDTYEPLNPQGWWDDEHWRKGGYYVAPYDTTRKYGEAMHAAGGLAFTYIQPTCLAGSLISKDFREQHVNWLCGKDVHRTLDYTVPAAQKHLREVFGALRSSIDGVMVDYCDDLWSHEATQGGFADKHVTSTAFYRSFFKFIKTGLGPNSWLHERNLNQPDNDLTLGIVDLQRTSWDTDQISPEMVSRSGLRWYKNRVVLGYDMDSKDLTNSWKVKGFNGSDEDGRRMMLTMAYVAASRLLLANSFRDLPPAILHDLSRTLPYPKVAQSARPIDAFVTDGWPQVYDFAISPKWHQLTLYNNALPTVEADFAVPLSGEIAGGALGLNGSKDFYCYDFWNERFVGRLHGTEALRQTLRPGEARMISIHEVEANPQFISTSRHLMQGYLDLSQKPVWTESKRTLSGTAQVIGGEPYEMVIALNGWQADKISATGGQTRMEPCPRENGLLIVKLEAPENSEVAWEVICRR